MNYKDAEKIIDLKMLFFFILKRRRRILLCMLIGILLGCGFAALRGEQTAQDYDTSKLNMEYIIQYEHFQQLFQQQLENEATSVRLQMDPASVYQTYRTFFLTMPVNEAELIKEKYSLILSDVNVLNEIIEKSGLECDQRAIKELVKVYIAQDEPSTLLTQFGLAPTTATLTVEVVAPSHESGDAMMTVLNEKVMQMNELLLQQVDGMTVETLANSYQFGYSEDVKNAQQNAANALNNYTTSMAELEKKMSDDDLDYYALIYAEEKEVDQVKELLSAVKRYVKYAIVFSALFCIAMIGIYGLQFLLDDHIKTAHEVHEYDLYTIACLQASQTRKDWVDKLLSDDKLPNNSREYALNAMKVLCDGNLVLSGDLKDQQVTDAMNWFAERMEGLKVLDCMASDDSGLLSTKESEGAILFIRLWKTTAFDLKRELYVLKQINKPVKGVIVLRG